MKRRSFVTGLLGLFGLAGCGKLRRDFNTVEKKPPGSYQKVKGKPLPKPPVRTVTGTVSEDGSWKIDGLPLEVGDTLSWTSEKDTFLLQSKKTPAKSGVYKITSGEWKP